MIWHMPGIDEIALSWEQARRMARDAKEILIGVHDAERRKCCMLLTIPKRHFIAEIDDAERRHQEPVPRLRLAFIGPLPDILWVD